MYPHQEIRRFGHEVDKADDAVYLGRVIACDSLAEELGDGVKGYGRGSHGTEIRSYRAVEDGVT